MEENKVRITTMLESLKSFISEIRFMDYQVFDDEDFDNLLDLREKPDFEAEWLRVYEEIEEQQKMREIASDVKVLIDTICEMAFKRAYSLTKNSEIAGYVSDDFELLAKAAVLNYQDSWLSALLLSYQNGQFPCSKLTQSSDIA
jgi:hypothetical protein